MLSGRKGLLSVPLQSLPPTHRSLVLAVQGPVALQPWPSCPGEPGTCRPRARVAGRHLSADGCGRADSRSPARGCNVGCVPRSLSGSASGVGQTELRPRATRASQPAGDRGEPRWPQATQRAGGCARDLLYPQPASRGGPGCSPLAGEPQGGEAACSKAVSWPVAEPGLEAGLLKPGAVCLSVRGPTDFRQVFSLCVAVFLLASEQAPRRLGSTENTLVVIPGFQRGGGQRQGRKARAEASALPVTSWVPSGLLLPSA